MEVINKIYYKIQFIVYSRGGRGCTEYKWGYCVW
jgi:hypothetical protein